MLDVEHFVDVKAIFKKAEVRLPSGINVPKDVRRIIEDAPVDEAGVRRAHLKRDERYYRVSQTGTVLSIEGFVGWPHRQESTRNPYLFPEHMTPVEITESGTIFSQGARISAMDERLGVLASDLMLGRPISGEIYDWEESRVDDHR